jgi:hypothetical protein
MNAKWQTDNMILGPPLRGPASAADRTAAKIKTPRVGAPKPVIPCTLLRHFRHNPHMHNGSHRNSSLSLSLPNPAEQNEFYAENDNLPLLLN